MEELSGNRTITNQIAQRVFFREDRNFKVCWEILCMFIAMQAFIIRVRLRVGSMLTGRYGNCVVRLVSEWTENQAIVRLCPPQ